MQDTVAEMAKDIKAKRTGDTSASAAELYAFVNRVRHASALVLWLQQQGVRLALVLVCACAQLHAASNQASKLSPHLPNAALVLRVLIAGAYHMLSQKWTSKHSAVDSGGAVTDQSNCSLCWMHPARS